MTQIPEDIMQKADRLAACSLTEGTIGCDVLAGNIARAILEERQRRRWHPIDTAPKDGTWVFVFVPGHGPARARWNRKADGWQSHNSRRIIDKATDWMPLPDAPKGGEA